MPKSRLKVYGLEFRVQSLRLKISSPQKSTALGTPLWHIDIYIYIYMSPNLSVFK